MTEELGGFRAPHKWECLTVSGEALRASVPCELCVVRPDTELPQDGEKREVSLSERGGPVRSRCIWLAARGQNSMHK